MDFNQMTLGEKIQSLREDKKITQKGLATILGVTVGIVAEWEADETEPDSEALVKLGVLFSTSLVATEEEKPTEEYVVETTEILVETPVGETIEFQTNDMSKQKDEIPTKKKKRLIPLIIGSVLVVVVVIVGVLLWGQRPMSADKLYQQVSQSVVVVSCDSSTGTGFFIDSNGTVVTNYHVIEKCKSAEIILSDGRKYVVNKVLGYSETKDIAILLTSCKNSVPLKLRESQVKTGDQVYAIGTTEGIFEGTLSEGIVSAAERELDGELYIQFTAPVSHGNSGGPLLDNKGRVVGIVSLGWVEGQNINFAIPITEVDKISTKYPITFSEVYQQTVQTMSDWDFFHYDDFDKFVLTFRLSDEDDVTMTCGGTAEIKIINNDGVTVYNQKRTFTEDDFEIWTINQTIEKQLASIYINPSEITTGTSAEGKIKFTVYGNGYSFEETTIDCYDLPIKAVTINLPTLPTTVTDSWSYGAWTKTRIDNITYKIVDGDTVYMYFSGEKTYDYSGNSGDSSCTFKWKLYDSEGYLVDSGSVFTGSLSVGDKFKDEEAYIWDKIKPGQTYTLVLTDSD